MLHRVFYVMTWNRPVKDMVNKFKSDIDYQSVEGFVDYFIPVTQEDQVRVEFFEPGNKIC